MSKERKTNLPTRESRFLADPIEIRAGSEEEESPKVRGYAAVFNRESENLGSAEYQFREVIEPGAFDDVLNDDVRALFNHSDDHILARSKNGEGTLKLGTDERGLWYEFDAPDTQAGRDLMTSIKRGDVDQSSFSFTVAEDGQRWEERQEGDGPVIVKRTITKVARLYDVSPVTFPAYPDATVALRSLKEFRQEQEDENESEATEEKQSIGHWQRRIALIDKPATNQETA